MSSDSDSPVSILDSHIHLYPEREISTLAWCSSDHPLAGQKSPDVYRQTIDAANAKEEGKSTRPFLGAIFVETDRKHDITVSPPDYSGPFAELAWLRRIVEGTPKDGEGHGEEDKALLSAIVAWAPVPLGAEALAGYLKQAQEVAGPATWKKVRGFRYLLQDKPVEAGLDPRFIESLKELGRRGYAFDVGIDLHRRGKKQIDVMVEMIEAAHEGVAENERVAFVLGELLSLCFPKLCEDS